MPILLMSVTNFFGSGKRFLSHSKVPGYDLLCQPGSNPIKSRGYPFSLNAAASAFTLSAVYKRCTRWVNPNPQRGGNTPPPLKRLNLRIASSGVGPANTYTSTPPAGTNISTASEYGRDDQFLSVFRSCSSGGFLLSCLIPVPAYTFR